MGKMVFWRSFYNAEIVAAFLGQRQLVAQACEIPARAQHLFAQIGRGNFAIAFRGGCGAPSAQIQHPAIVSGGCIEPCGPSMTYHVWGDVLTQPGTIAGIVESGLDLPAAIVAHDVGLALWGSEQVPLGGHAPGKDQIAHSGGHLDHARVAVLCLWQPQFPGGGVPVFYEGAERFG